MTTGRGAPGKGMNRWTYQQRVCLSILHSPQHANLSSKERAEVFNHIYKDHLAACGIPPPGLKRSALDCQYGERRYSDRPTWQVNWGDVCNPPDTDEDRVLRERLRNEVAAALQRDEDDIIEVAVQSGTPPPPLTPRPQYRHSGRTTTPADPYARLYATPITGSRKRPATTPPRTPRMGDNDEIDELAAPITPPTTQRPQRVHNGGAATGQNSYARSYATPGPSSRKRPAAAQSSPIDEGITNLADDDDEVDPEYLPLSKRTKAPSPHVVIPSSPETVFRQRSRAVARNTQTRYRSGGREGAAMLLHRMSGGPIWLTPEEYAQAMEPLVNVTEEAAHPNPPAILFRYWSVKSHGLNSKTDGFVSGRFTSVLVEPRGPPNCDVLEWNDVGHHLNNGGHDQKGHPSPFISTSNLLVWVIRMALKQADEEAYISVIDTSKLDPKSIFHVPPFYEQLKKKRVFYKGGFNYRGSHEHLIWHKIPSFAILNTFSVAEIITFSQTTRALSKVLRLDQLAAAKSGATEIIKQLKQGEVRIGRRVAAAIAETVMFLGLDHTSSREKLSRAVSEIAQGWALKADGESQSKADDFIKAFGDRTDDYISIPDQVKLKHAFLHGIEWSCGDLNIHLKGRVAYDLMKTRALRRGLADSGRLMASELDGAKRAMALFSREQERLQMRPAERRALMLEYEVVEEEDEAVMQLGHLELEEGVLYE